MSILSQDLTALQTPSNIKDVRVSNAYHNEPWLSIIASSNIIEQKFIKVDRDLLYQILIVENISHSKLSQIDDLKSKIDPKNQKVDRLKTKVITQIVDEDDNSTTVSNNPKSVYKLTLQDKLGRIFFAITATPMPWISCTLGAKIIIKPGTSFNRGVFILRDTNVVFLGGINTIWNENKDDKLQHYLQSKLSANDKNNSKKRKTPPTVIL